MALPVLTYNASSGSDTAASGAGPATAVTGTDAAHTFGSASTTITFTNSPDLSGVSADGSAVLWLNTSSGSRHLSRITAVDDGADTVTVEDSFNIAELSAISYAIGGKRQTIHNDNAQYDTEDAGAGWTFEFEAGTYTLYDGSGSVPASYTPADPAIPIIVRSSDPGTVRPVFTFDGIPDFSTVNWGSGTHLIGIDVTCTQTLFLTMAFGTGTGGNSATDCVFTYTGTVNTTEGYSLLNLATITDCVLDGGVNWEPPGFEGSRAYRCTFRDCNRLIDGGCISVDHIAFDKTMFSMELCTVFGGSGSGLVFRLVHQGSVDNAQIIIRNCTFHDNAEDGIEIVESGTSAVDHVLISISECAFTNNGRYGIGATSNMEDEIGWDIRNNLFNGNTTAAYNNVPAGFGELTSAPNYVSTTGGSEDFTPDTGSPLIDAGYDQPEGA